MMRPSVLHLEDDAKDHKLVRAALAQEQIDAAIERVDSADTFRAAISGTCYDLILADYNLRGFDGFTALNIARKVCPDVPFIVVSGAMGDMAVADILRAGATDFILKDHLDRLGPAMRRALSEAAERKARHEAEAAMREAKDVAVAANQAKDRFLAMLSHELRTPLAPVVMTLRSMQADADMPAKFAADLAMVQRNIGLEVALIDDLLDLSRVISGKLRLREGPANLHALIEHVLASIRPEFEDKDISLRHELNASNDLINGDAARLQQVVWNLLRNALKFTPAGGSVTIRTSNANDGTLRLEVTDTGRGIPPAALAKLFEPFEQVSPDVTRDFGGLGLGLAIVRAVVELHRGTTWAASGGLGSGASFFVELPLGQRDEARTPSVAPKSAARSAGGAIRVLLVEDHEDTRRMLARLLKLSGFDVGVASSVQSALDLAAVQNFDILVSDIGLPDGTGHDVMAKVRESYDLKGIALSGYGMEEDIARGRAAGFSEHIVKPVDLDHLQRSIRTLVGHGVAAGA